MTEQKKPKFTWQQKWFALKRQLLPYKNTIITLSILEVVVAAANGVVPYITGKFFDALITPAQVGMFPTWAIALALWAVMQIGANGLGFFIDRKSRFFTTELEAAIQARAFVHLLTLPVPFHKKNRSGELAEMITRAGWMLASMANTILTLAPQFLTVLIGIGISFFMQPFLAGVLLVGVGFYLVVLSRTLPQSAHLQEEAGTIWNRTYGDASDAYINVQTVKQAGAEQYEATSILHGFLEEAVPTWNRMERLWSNLNFSQRIIVTLTQGAVLLFSVFLVADGKITIGELIAFNAYAGMIIGPFVSIGHQWQNVQNGLTTLARTERIFGSDSERYEPEDAIAIGQLKGQVEFDDVHFSYEPDQLEVLKGVSFKTNPGEIVAFVGETGVGKSTSAELISGYYFANSGEVLIDGVDIKKINLRDLRNQMAVVPQEVVLFNSSIGDNIRYGRPDATDAEVEEAAKKAHADGFIEKFPEKYKQEVGERGIKLSVGQKQRVAIARAMLRNPRILILDEPTSALDAETERYITKSLEELMRGRTTFIIAHRLSTVRKADKILVLKEGVVAEQGRHEELMQIENGVYRHLYELHIGLHE